MTQNQCYEMCKKIAPQFGFDPILILAVCKQESSFGENMRARYEDGYRKTYVEKFSFNIATELLFSFSYGIMQVMGLTLWEMGYFGKAKNAADIANLISVFAISYEEQLTQGCKCLKQKLGKGPIDHALYKYNGSWEYPPLIFAHADKLAADYGLQFDRGSGTSRPLN